MQDCVVRDQTIASVRLENDQSYFNLGNGVVGGNQLSAISGVALEDLRDDPFPSTEIIQAQGITLNGRSYSEQPVQGPVDASPDYRILAAGLIRF